MESQGISFLWKELLPGICDDVTLTYIATKLPWTAFHVLPAVSRTWQRAIESRTVYGERIRCQATNTLVVVKHRDENLEYIQHHNSISLYCMREKTFYRLPPIPQLKSGISVYTQFISVDGKLYVLGAGSDYQFNYNVSGDIYYDDSDDDLEAWTREQRNPERMQVYVFDLAGERQWKECNTIHQPERQYTVSIGNGYKVGALHFVKGGSANWFKSFWQQCSSTENEWREEEREWRQTGRRTRTFEIDLFVFIHYFMVQGKYYSIRRSNQGEMNDEIKVLDTNTQSWTHHHSISYREIELEVTAKLGRRSFPVKTIIFLVLPLNDELLALAYWKRHSAFYYDEGYCALQTKGFGTEKKELVWEIVPNTPAYFGPKYSVAICPIQL